jgi:hypothetical protein
VEDLPKTVNLIKPKLKAIGQPEKLSRWHSYPLFENKGAFSMIEPVSPAVLKASLFGAVIGAGIALYLSSLPDTPKNLPFLTLSFVSITLGSGVVVGRFAQLVRGE